MLIGVDSIGFLAPNAGRESQLTVVGCPPVGLLADDANSSGLARSGTHSTSGDHGGCVGDDLDLQRPGQASRSTIYPYPAATIEAVCPTAGSFGS